MPYKNPHPLYYVWAKIRYRARKTGAYVCPEWQNFSAFLADVGEKQEGKLLTLRDNSLGYIKGNLVWVTESEKLSIKTGYKPSVSHPLYTVWRSMISRCTDQASPHFANYGGRGISICERWRHDFHAFVADMGDRPPDTSIDRINNDGNYEPSNCRWATKKQQQSNRRVNILIAFNGETKPLKHWADAIGVKPDTIAERLRNGVPADVALTTKRLPRDLSGLQLGGDASGRKKQQRTHCIHGHAFTIATTYINKFGHRVCRTCHRQRERDRKKTKKPR